MNFPNLNDVEAAARRLGGYSILTPLLRNPDLDATTGGTILIKAENLQRNGSFKFRGAYNRIAQIPPGDRPAGVVACSSGNHAQGVADAARLFDIPATIVMPSDAPAIKIERTERLGAKVVLYERASGNREQIARRIANQAGATFVHPYDDPEMIAGQGTVGLEIAEQAASMGLRPDAVVVNAGGGGLTAGITVAMAALLPDCEIYTAEPAGFDDHARSLAAGERLGNPATSGSLCDALLAEMPGELTFAINRERLAGGLVVSDDEALAAVAYAARELNLVLEPGGAVALAAVLNGRLEVRDKTIAIIASGGNVDPQLLAELLGG